MADLLPANSTITGFGTIETPHDVLKPFVNDGVITGQDSFGSISLPGYVTGSGSLDFVRIQGTLSPGAGPSLVSYGIVAFSTSSRLVIEIGGTVAGTQYDQLAFSQLFGEALIDGKLEIALINGFIPEIGDSFAIFDQAEAIVGEFSSLDLPALPADRKWKLFQDSQTLTVAVLATHPWHNRLKTRDVDADNHIVASDALDVINYLNAFGATTVPEDAPNLKPFLDVVPDNFVTAGDALEIINFLNAGLGGEGEFSGMPTRTQTTPADSLENLIQLLSRRQRDTGPAAAAIGLNRSLITHIARQPRNRLGRSRRRMALCLARLRLFLGLTTLSEPVASNHTSRPLVPSKTSQKRPSCSTSDCPAGSRPKAASTSYSSVG